VAYFMGDSTAKYQGRLTLNPLKHLDPVGTAMLFIFGFGWARPVPVNFQHIRSARLGLILVASAGIIANMIFAFVAVLLLRLLSPSPSGSTGLFLYYLAQINIMLASFNLIPIPPLDGSKILMGFMSERLQYAFSRLEPFGFFIIIGLLYLGALNPVIQFFRWSILALIGILL
ncbi:MAG: site-2 protease family protein, partial [Thermodesulfobacteriota bacterium]